jgi:hypothetical protein
MLALMGNHYYPYSLVSKFSPAREAPNVTTDTKAALECAHCPGSGAKYLLLSALLYAPGVILFAKAKHEQGEPLFTHIKKGIFICVVAGAGLAAYGLYSGMLSL